MMGSEKTFENKIKAFLTEQKCWFIKYWAGAKFTKSGVPDILCCCNGRFLGIEVKSANGKPSPLQIWNLKMIEKAGGYGILLYPKDFETFKDLVVCMNKNALELENEIYDELKGVWKDRTSKS